MFINFIVFSMIIFYFLQKKCGFYISLFFRYLKKKLKFDRFFLLYKNCDNKFDYEFVKEMMV